MPLRVPVPSLQSLSIIRVTEILINSMHTPYTHGTNIIEKYTSIKSYFNLLPYDVFENLLHYIMTLEELDASVRYYLLKIFLSPQTKSLCIGIFPQSFYQQVADVICCQGHSLQRLDLRGVWLKGELSQCLIRILQNAKHLVSLHIPHMATDEVLETMNQCNRHLQVVDITGECNISQQGIACLGPGLDSLRLLLLGNPGGCELEPQQAADILQRLPLLQSLGTYPHIGQALQYLAPQEIDYTTNLHHVRDSYTDISLIKIIIQKTPKLKSVYLDHPSDNVLPQLCNYKYVNKIKFNRFKLYEFCSLIGQIGDQIYSIELLHGYGVLDLTLLNKHCPNLRTFTCYHIESIQCSSVAEFKNLKKIGIYYSDINTLCIKSMILSAPFIESISFGDILEMTDDDIIRIFTTREYAHLKHIWFPNAAYLTSTSVQILITTCPQLQSLGELRGWNLLENDIRLCCEEIAAANLDMKLIEYSNELY